MCTGSVLSIRSEILQSEMGMTEFLHLTTGKLLKESRLGFVCTVSALKASVSLSLRIHDRKPKLFL